MSDTSASLLERLRLTSDAAAWQRLVELYRPLIEGWLRRHLVPPADADDLLQDVLAVLVCELPRFEHNGRPGAFRGWLRQITVHRLRDFWRARHYQPEATGDSAFVERLEQLHDPHSEMRQLWDADHDRHVVRRLMELVRDEFQPATQQAFEAVMLRGERPAEVAARLGVSVNAVLLAKSRILRRLRQENNENIEILWKM